MQKAKVGLIENENIVFVYADISKSDLLIFYGDFSREFAIGLKSGLFN